MLRFWEQKILGMARPFQRKKLKDHQLVAITVWIAIKVERHLPLLITDDDNVRNKDRLQQAIYLLLTFLPLGCWLGGVFGGTRWFGTIVLKRGSSGNGPKHRAQSLLHHGGSTLRLIVYIDSDLQRRKEVNSLAY